MFNTSAKAQASLKCNAEWYSPNSDHRGTSARMDCRCANSNPHGGDGGRHLQVAKNLAAGFELRNCLFVKQLRLCNLPPRNFYWIFRQIQREHKN
jgi:hypothetical protein